jgi:hypothetical protein
MGALRKAVEKHGIENVKVLIDCSVLEKFLFISFTSSSTPRIKAVCSLSEERYEFFQNYKVTLVPDYDIADYKLAKHEFYTLDLETIIRDGKAEILIKVDPET